MAKSTLPLTVRSKMGQHYSWGAIIGQPNDSSTYHSYTPQQPATNAYWLAVVDRETLELKASEVQNTADSVPSSILGYAGDSRNLLIVSTGALSTLNVPQGNLYQFLLDNGAGREFLRIEQINDTLGSSEYGRVSYALVSILGTGLPGFEDSMLHAYPPEAGPGVVLTLKLRPVPINGKEWYTPEALG